MKLKIDKAKEKLNRYINQFGLNHENTIKQSKKVDFLVVEEQKARLREVLENKAIKKVI